MSMDEPELRPLGPEEVGLLYRRELKGTFPPSELKPLRTIQRHMRAGRYPAWDLYQGEKLTAYALLWQTVDGRAVLLDYLGVPRDRRGQGWGSRMLTQLRRIYGERAAILAEVEAPEAAEPGERSLQERRLDFYCRAGFRYAGFDSRRPGQGGGASGGAGAAGGLPHPVSGTFSRRCVPEIRADPVEPAGVNRPIGKGLLR